MIQLLILLLNFNLFSIEIIERENNNITIKTDNIDDLEYKLFESKNGKEFDMLIPRIIRLSSKKNKIADLKANTKYLLQDSKSKIEFWTLADEPTKAKTNIMFLKANANDIKGRVNITNAEGALLLVSINEDISNLKDGKEYTAGKYGSNNNKIASSYIIKKMTNGEVFILENLKYDIYNFTLIPFNGSGESINYFSSKTDIRKYHPQLEIPKVKECEYFKENIAEIKWKEVAGTKYYEVSVAKDPNFNDILEEYNQANFNNGTEFKLYLEDESIKYYWKIKAVGLYNSSDFSEFQVIDNNLINSAKK